MGVKIQDITSKSAKIASTDLIEIAQVSGATYISRKVTGSEINELSLDTSPQLGGNLDVNGNKIISTSNANISIEPNGTGAVIIGGNSTQATELRFMEDSDNGTNYVALKSNNTLASNTTYTLPTADGTSGQVLSTNGTGTLSWATAGGGITVGTTAITSGTVGRILFEGTGNVLQEDSALFWDNTNKRLGVGATPSTSVRLDVRAQGALSTDIAFRVRNSADTVDLFSVQGNAITNFGGGTSSGSQLQVVCGALGFGTNLTLQFASSRSISCINGGQVETGIRINHNSNTRVAGLMIGSSTSTQVFIDGGQNIRIGQGYSNLNQPDANATRTIQQMTGVAPTTSVADGYQLYSADVVAGNAAPHFRTENGAIVKVYQETTVVAASTLVGNAGTNITDTDTFDGYTLKQIVKALRNQGLLA